MKNYIKIRQGVRPNGDSYLDDVMQVKKSLNALGYYDKPKQGINEFPDQELFSSIKRFQKDNDLKIDGILMPNGETEKMIDNELKQKLGARSPTIWCPICTGPHGGVDGPVCPECTKKGLA